MRFKRAAGDNLDLGDRLVEKLAEQKHQMEAKIGNMTCVMRELNVLDASNNIDVQAMKRDTQKYTMPSEWFKNKYEHLLDTCYEMMHQMKNRNTFSPYSSMSSNSHHGDSKMDTMKMMMQMMKMKNMMKNDDYSSSSYNSDNAFDMFSDMFDQQSNYKSSSDYNNQMGRMSQFKNMFNSMRFKRAAGDNLDLGDRLVEKLAEQKHQMEAKIGNMTCVMRELNVLDASNNIDVQAMKRDTQKYTMPSEW